MFNIDQKVGRIDLRVLLSSPPAPTLQPYLRGGFGVVKGGFAVERGGFSVDREVDLLSKAVDSVSKEVDSVSKEVVGFAVERGGFSVKRGGFSVGWATCAVGEGVDSRMERVVSATEGLMQPSLLANSLSVKRHTGCPTHQTDEEAQEFNFVTGEEGGRGTVYEGSSAPNALK
eukprot:1988834-Pyramimonas_sp.AAC.2